VKKVWGWDKKRLSGAFGDGRRIFVQMVKEVNKVNLTGGTQGGKTVGNDGEKKKRKDTLKKLEVGVRRRPYEGPKRKWGGPLARPERRTG